jgi:nitrogen fixation NifU-like protein
MVALAIAAAVETYEKRVDEPDYPAITYKIKSTCTPKEEADESSND